MLFCAAACHAPALPRLPLLQLAVVGNTLWLFGGTVEVGEREITLDDLWRLGEGLA